MFVSIYIMDLDRRLSDLGCGVELMKVRVNSLLFADDLLLVAESEEEMDLLLRTFHSWCDDYRMQVSELKSKIVSSSDLEVWEILTPDFDFVCCIELLYHHKYLGVEVYPTLARMTKSLNDKISSRAASFAKSILNVSKTKADKVSVILAMWRNMALPALLYSTEVIPMTETCISSIERWQCVVGKAALGVRTLTANELTNIDLGMLQ